MNTLKNRLKALRLAEAEDFNNGEDYHELKEQQLTTQKRGVLFYENYIVFIQKN